jgi:putative acetyltransferase
VIQIEPIEPSEVEAAKRVILAVARNNFHWEEPLDEIIHQFNARGELEDVDNYKTVYLEQKGLFLVVTDQGQVVGTGAIRQFEGDTAELKRLWLLEAYHGQGIGYQLVQTLFNFARNQGFKRVRLLTDRRQSRAIYFYQQVGFHRIECPSDDPNDVCMEMTI